MAIKFYLVSIVYLLLCMAAGLSFVFIGRQGVTNLLLFSPIPTVMGGVAFFFSFIFSTYF